MTTLRLSLKRLLSPASVAVVGASENLGMSNNAVLPMLEAGLTVHLVNPNRDSVYGQPAVRTLGEIGHPVDAVLALVNATRSVDVVEEAAALGCGGVVVAAAGFSELGPEGVALQDRLLAAARVGPMAVVGPNCSGFKNVPLGVNLFTGGRLDLTPGCVSIVSQSGFLVRAAMAAAAERRLGVGIAVSSGNEAVCDLADHVDVLVDDPGTSVICLVVETIRRPPEFFDAVARARAAGKAVLALKLGRTDRARRIMQSHTGAIADESWVYDLAFREHGIIGVGDIDGLLDAAQLFAQLPRDRWSAVDRIGIITTSGGVAALATDLADEEGVVLPDLGEIEPWVRERVPGDTVNPLDLTGFVMSRRDVMEELFSRYADSVDLLALAWWLGDGDEGWSTTLLEPFAAVAAAHDTPFLVTPVESTSLGPWVPSWREQGLVFARGVQSLYRAADAMTRHVRATPRLTAAPATAGSSVSSRSTGPPPVPAERAPVPDLVSTDVGSIVPFGIAMRLLTEVGIPVAPWVLIEVDDEPIVPARLGGRCVVKLADVPHRTELGAVELDVEPGDVARLVARLREIAAGEGVPATVAVQAMVSGHGEVFAGLHGRTGLGPVVLLGRGGVLVEIAGGVAGRMLPLDERVVAELVEEVAGSVARAPGATGVASTGPGPGDVGPRRAVAAARNVVGLGRPQPADRDRRRRGRRGCAPRRRPGTDDRQRR